MTERGRMYSDWHEKQGRDADFQKWLARRDEFEQEDITEADIKAIAECRRMLKEMEDNDSACS